jgi:hypothetical protein
MTKADEFRMYTKALQCASKSKAENKRLALIELAGTWSKAADASEMIFGSSLGSPPHAADELRSLTRS